jgi:3-methyladenine DNA glycosylase Mpg
MIQELFGQTLRSIRSGDFADRAETARAETKGPKRYPTAMAITFTLTGAEFANASGYALRVGAIVPCSRPAARIGTRKVALDALWNRSLAGKGISPDRRIHVASHKGL